jgi:hypothetical protein
MGMRGRASPSFVSAAALLMVAVAPSAVAIGAEPASSKDEVFLREAGTWDVTYKQWPQGTILIFGEPTQHFRGVEINTISADGTTLRKKHSCRELELAEPLGGPAFRRRAFQWTTGHDLTLSHDPATRTYSGHWSKEDEKEMGSMKGQYDQKTKTLLLSYVDPKMPQNAGIRHETRYIDEKTKRVTISFPTPENASAHLPTSWIMFEMVATKRAK